MNWETLMCFGDSITIGARSYCGYPEYAGSALEKRIGNRWNVINHAVSGYRSIDLARYITSDFSNLKQFVPGLVTILIGTNDVKCHTSPGDFTIAYKQVIIKSLLLCPSKNVLLITIPEFPKHVAYPYTFRMNELIREYNNIISCMASEFGLRKMTFELSPQDLFDGVHFNSSGSARAGEQLASFIEADKGLGESSHDNIISLRAVNG